MTDQKVDLNETVELSEEEYRECYERAENILEKNGSLNKELNLLKDHNTIPGQEYAIISCVGPNETAKSDKFAIKVMGTFDTLENAQNHCKILHDIDNTFDIYVVEMYAWLPLPPDPNMLKDQVYADEHLNTLIVEHKREQERARQVFDARKEQLMNKAPKQQTEEEDPEERIDTDGLWKTLDQPNIHPETTKEPDTILTAEEMERILEDAANELIDE